MLGRAGMKHATRDAGVFVGSVVGAGIIGFILFQFLAGPCPRIAGIDSGAQCVGSMTLGEWTTAAGAVGAVIGFVLGMISESLPDKGQAA